MTYQEFLESKSQVGSQAGFEPLWMPDFLFPFQKSLVDWSVRQGRAAIFADCGMGKSPMQLVWSENVVRKADGNVLIIAPLAVSAQTAREGEKFGIGCHVSRDGSVKSRITITNYERIHYFNPDDFVGVVCDEASALKAFDGRRRKQVTRFLSKQKYRLLCTATPAPNDFIELGTESEALGVLTQSEMLSQFFKASDNKRHTLFKEGDFWNRPKWFFRPHAELPFWRWVCSWARACRRPSDLGPEFDDSAFQLPELMITQHTLPSEFVWPGELFPRIARTLQEQRVERKHAMRSRCEKVAALIDHGDQALIWGQGNEECDFLEKIIPGCVQVAGRDGDDAKEGRLLDFAEGRVRVLVTKPKIASFGLNFQNCGHHTFFPDHSFEQFHQGIRRSWRYGRTGPVRVDVVATEGEEGVTENLKKKEVRAEQMFEALVREMHRGSRLTVDDRHIHPIEAPSWL